MPTSIREPESGSAPGTWSTQHEMCPLWRWWPGRSEAEPGSPAAIVPVTQILIILHNYRFPPLFADSHLSVSCRSTSSLVFVIAGSCVNSVRTTCVITCAEPWCGNSPSYVVVVRFWKMRACVCVKECMCAHASVFVRV